MFKTGTVNDGTSSKALSPIQAILQTLVSVNTQYMQELNEKYFTAVKTGDIEAAQKFVDKTAQRAGYIIRAYHGTSRGDRVGNVFLPERAPSGSYDN